MAVEVGAAANEYAIAVAVLLSAVDVDVRRVVKVEATHPGFARARRHLRLQACSSARQRSPMVRAWCARETIS